MRIIVIVLLVLCVLSVTSCAIVRGYRADGPYGPHIFSFERHPHETVPNGPETFRFPVADKRADWIDTLHFFTQEPEYVNLTLAEALEPKGQTQGVLIIHHDRIVYEKLWGDFTSDRLATVFSISKSITSLLCGVAVDDGYIRSIDDPVTDYLPELKKGDPMWQKLTIRHLLNMRSGLDFDDTYSLTLKDLKRLNAMARLNYGHHLMRQIRGLKFRCEPGTEFRYESMTSQILGVVVERASGKRYADYLSERIWKPLGMESPALINVDSKKNGMAHAFGGITLTMRDLAKIGRLYLDKGQWNGKRIVSEEWIRKSSEYDSENNRGYHFNWYDLSHVGEPKAACPGFFAEGIKGQILYVNPYKDLIMVHIGFNNLNNAYIPILFEQLANRWPE